LSIRSGRGLDGTSKAVCEHILFAVSRSYGLPMSIVRLFNVYGPRQKPIFAIPAMVCRVLKGQNPLVYGSGKQTRCFTFVDDAVEGMIKASESPKAEGEAFNLGSNREVTIVDLAKLIINIAGRTKGLEPEFVDPKQFYSSYEDLERRMPETAKAKRLLGWEACTDLSLGLRKTVDFFRSQMSPEPGKRV